MKNKNQKEMEKEINIQKKTKKYQQLKIFDLEA